MSKSGPPSNDDTPDPGFVMDFYPSAREYLPAMGEKIKFISISDVWCVMIRCSRNGTPLKMAIKKLKQYSGDDEELSDLTPL